MNANTSPKEAVEAVQKVSLQVHEHFKKYDHTKFIEFHARLLKDKELVDEFSKDPNKVVERETGIPNMDGAHYHFFDENNEFFPPEEEDVQEYMSGNAEGAWSRMEIRLSSQGGSSFGTCILFCTRCR